MSNKTKNGISFSSVDLLIYMWNKKWILILVTFLAGVSSIIISLQITEKFKSTVVMFPTTGASISKSLLATNYSGRQDAYGFGEEEQAEQLIQVLNSEFIKSRIIEKYNLMEHYGIDPDSRYPYTQLMGEYSSNISFRRTELMSVEISVLDTDPQVAADIANDISNLVDSVYNQMKQKRALAAFELVEREYEDARKDVAILKDSLEDVGQDMAVALQRASSSSIADLGRAVAEHIGTFRTLTNQLDHETGRLADLRQRYQEARVESVQELPHKFIVDVAYPAEKKAYPKRSVIVMVSTAAGFLFTLILLIVIDSLKERVILKQED